MDLFSLSMDCSGIAMSSFGVTFLYRSDKVKLVERQDRPLNKKHKPNGG